MWTLPPALPVDGHAREHIIRYLARKCEGCFVVVLVFLLSFREHLLYKRMPKTRTSKGSVRACGRGRGGSRRRSTRSSVTRGEVPGHDDTSVSDSSVAPHLGSPATNPPSEGNTSLPNLLQMIREEVREQLAMQAPDRQPPSSLAGPPVTTGSTTDVASSLDSV